MTDNLITCPKCKEPLACYKTPINEFHNAYSCLGCGFNTSDLMVEGEYDVEAYEEELPELYKDIKYKDEENRVWYPNVVNIDGLGTVFANGASKDDWQWSGIKSVLLTEEEKEQPKFKGKTHKSDSKTLENFGQRGYFEACDYIGLFDVND
jgi:hypothetical protein